MAKKQNAYVVWSVDAEGKMIWGECCATERHAKEDAKYAVDDGDRASGYVTIEPPPEALAVMGKRKAKGA